MISIFARHLVSHWLGSRTSSVEYWMSHQEACQQQVWQTLIQRASSTEWGKQHDYSRIRSIADFQQAVPVSEYDDIKHYIAQMLDGKPDVLWRGTTHWFAKSSGTTSDKSKFIPITADVLKECHYKAGADSLTRYRQMNPKTGIFSGKGLVMGGSHQISHHSALSRYGDLSAVLLQNMPWAGQVLRAPRLSIALMDNWEEKLEAIAQTTIKENITYLAGVPTWTLLLLRRIRELSGFDDISQVWKNLELYLHGGVNFAPYSTQFEQLIPKKTMQYWQTYNASEGFFGMQEDSTRNDMMLAANHGVFCEFVPLKELSNKYPQALLLPEVELNTHYALVISTCGGLWRYLLGDTIVFTSLNPYRIRVSGRTKHFINAFGEELMVDNTDKAIAEACRQTGARTKDYTAAPVFMDTNGQRGCHEWLIEFEQEPADLLQFTQILDRELQNANSDYEAKRRGNMVMQMPLVQSVPTNTFYEWLKSKGKVGGQHKVPRLSNERVHIEEIKKSFLK